MDRTAFFERLEKKSNEVENLLQQNTFDWEATFFNYWLKVLGSIQTAKLF
nr:DUF2851 family protein [Flavobacterium piscinae]